MSQTTPQITRMALLIALTMGLFTIASVPVYADSDITIYATAQRFENGLMIWRSDSGTIWVLSDTGYANSYAADHVNSLPDNPYTNAPPGMIRPINGFGRIWGYHAFIRDQLGWALLPEIGFAMRVITTNNATYLTQLDQTVIAIYPNHTWNIVDSVPDVPHPDVSIDRFDVTPDPVQQGGWLTLSWDVRGTQSALIEIAGLNDPPGHVVRLIEDLPLSGSTTITMPRQLTEGARITLWAVNHVFPSSPVRIRERVVKQTITVGIQPQAENIHQTYAAYQPYQNGFMIWQADTGAVTVFGGQVSGPRTTFAENMYGPLPDNPYYDVPAGLIRPINGFGRVWGNFETVRKMLGWATGPEEAYTLTIETDTYGNIQTFTLPDGRKVVFNRQFWRH